MANFRKTVERFGQTSIGLDETSFDLFDALPQLLEELKEFLESVSLTEKLKAEAEEANAQQEVLAKAPLPIFIG